MEPDFSGYVTKADLKCSDGLTISADAFKHQDKMRVPLVWQHMHGSADNVLGYVDLEHRDSSHPNGAGIYGYGFFNEATQGINARRVVQHGDVDKMSIYANQLRKAASTVVHGAIREVSLVLAGANPGATIDYVNLAHNDGNVETLDDEAIIHTGLTLEHETPEYDDNTVILDANVDPDNLSHAGSSDMTLQDIYDSMTQEQKDVCNYMVGAALESAGSTGGSMAQSDLPDDARPQEIYDAMDNRTKVVVHSMIEAAKEQAKNEAVAEHSALNPEGTTVNVFENQAQSAATIRHTAMMDARSKLSPERIKAIVTDGERYGSLKESFLAHAGDYGIDNIDLLFPDATLDQNGVSIISRRMEWVQDVLTNTRHSPFTRVKSLAADITAEEARARGYVKGNMKKDEVIKLLRRITGPKTIYKKQKLDRDDILDITELDIVAWLKAEMRVMLDEEVARAVLIGDGRDADDPDKIDEDHVRPVAYDVDMYTSRVNLTLGGSTSDTIDKVVNALDGYKGTGTPTLYTTQRLLTSMLLSKDTLGRRLYATKQELANALLVKDIVPVEAMEQDPDLVGVIVNLTDYTIGADKGGEVNMFDDFDIDFNQQKYLIETRISGALTKPKSAIALFIDSGRILPQPPSPTFNNSTGVLTIPTVANVTYMDDDTNTTLAPGNQSAIAVGATVNVRAVPAAGYGFVHPVNQEWSFTRTAS